MGWFDGFPFKSREQTEKERKAFERKIFPLGVDAQRAAALQVLREVTSPGMKDDQKLFAFISSKDKYLDQDTRSEGLALVRFHLKKQRWVSEEDMAAVAALVVLENGVLSLEEYPTAQQVQQAAAAIWDD